MSNNDGVLKTEVIDGVVVLSFDRGCLREEKQILTTLASLSKHIEERDKPRIVLDMGNVEYLSSAGLGQLVGLLKRARANNGDFKLCRLQNAIRELFDVMRLNTIFDLYESVDEARATFPVEA
ncbi:MAG: STAS domain-containing protein [Planctomycetota bacterium]